MEARRGNILNLYKRVVLSNKCTYKEKTPPPARVFIGFLHTTEGIGLGVKENHLVCTCDGTDFNDFICAHLDSNHYRNMDRNMTLM